MEKKDDEASLSKQETGKRLASLLHALKEGGGTSGTSGVDDQQLLLHNLTKRIKRLLDGNDGDGNGDGNGGDDGNGGA